MNAFNLYKAKILYEDNEISSINLPFNGQARVEPSDEINGLGTISCYRLQKLVFSIEVNFNLELDL